ncbi:MAG: hypothetical protein IJI37_00295 [Opitutales bacterium]|nr:hypothetical protein [Opitutales bacterium]
MFTFHGFRYLEVSGLPRRAVPDESWAGAKVVYNDMPATGSFVCSNAKLNKLQSNIQWGQKSNYISVPTDCPQRDERMGWTGDAQVFCPTGAFNMNTNAFFAKWCQDLLDEQSPDGAYPNVAPKGWGFGNPAWGDAGVICPYEIYLAYADKKILAQNYEGMKKWVAFMKDTSKNLIRPDIGYGDWLQPSITKVSPISDDWRGNTPRSLIGTAYFIKCADIVAKSADILGKKDDAKTCRKLANDAREAFIKEYYKSDGTIAAHTQTGYLLALAFDILPPEESKKAFAKFLEKFDADKRYLDTGFVGTPLIAPVLTKFGRNDLACALVLNEGYPSWIYSINQGATTMWERWNSYSKETGLAPAKMNSFNHYAYGAIGEWLYANVGGIWRCEKEPGYKTVVFAAKPAGGITSAEARLETPYGAALSSWKVEGGAMQWTVVVPPNSKGLVKLPAPAGKSLVDGMAASSREFELASGRHFIEAELN